MNAEQKTQLKDKGFCKLEGLFSETEIDALVDEITNIQRQNEEGWAVLEGIFDGLVIFSAVQGES